MRDLGRIDPEEDCDISRFMLIALEEATQAMLEGEVPTGAVLVQEGEVLARDHNRKEQLQDPTAHAEILVMRAAAETLCSWRLDHCELYVTMEPCPMCAGAMVQARLRRLIFGVRNPKAGAVVSLYRMLDDERLNHQVPWVEGVMAKECTAILKDFFSQLRNQNP